MSSLPENSQWENRLREHFSELETVHFKRNLNAALKALRHSSNYSSPESLKSIDILRKAGRPISTRQIVGDHLAKEGYAELFIKMWNAYLNKYITHDDFIVNEMLFLTRAVISQSPDLAATMGVSGALSLLLNQLKAPNITVDKLNDELVANYVLMIIVVVLIGIYQCKENREIYREANAISILNPYVQRLDPSVKETNKRLVKLGALLTLSYILNESETKTLDAADVNLCMTFMNLIHVKDPAIKASMSKSGISTAMILDGINRVALLNDTNKINFVRTGVVPLLLKILKEQATSFSEEDQILAARAMWNLSFVESNRKKLSTNADAIEGLKFHTQSQNKTLRDTCTTALWEIFEGNVGFLSLRRKSSATSAEYKAAEAKYKTIPSLLPILGKQPSITEEDNETEGDDVEDNTHIKVMISYQWDVQKSMLELRDKLRSTNKISVWMDVDKMKGNILEAMAEAIEESDVIVVCLSRKYKESLNCRTEASYAYKLQKPLVPLMVEDNYVPDGWLGALVGVELYYKISQKDHLNSQFPDILKAVEEKCQRSYHNEQPPIQKNDENKSLPQTSLLPQPQIPLTSHPQPQTALMSHTQPPTTLTLQTPQLTSQTQPLKSQPGSPFTSQPPQPLTSQPAPPQLALAPRPKPAPPTSSKAPPPLTSQSQMSPLTTSSSSPPIPSALMTKPVDAITTWSSHRVAQWLSDNDLYSELERKFSRIKGTHLKQMYTRFQRSPEVFDSNLKTDLQLDFITIVMLTTALEELFTS